ncbi:hypothetical protein HDU93_008575 [Gonapodya sp. JEL0774]|nr:hypothetical protein HDU93_008575 [Gonapodya sp. JEL0774]
MDKFVTRTARKTTKRSRDDGGESDPVVEAGIGAGAGAASAVDSIAIPADGDGSGAGVGNESVKRRKRGDDSDEKDGDGEGEGGKGGSGGGDVDGAGGGDAASAAPTRDSLLLAKLGSDLSSLLNLEITTMGTDWFDALLPEMRKPYFKKLKLSLAAELSGSTPIYPPQPDVYAWSRVPIKNVKVVILGQGECAVPVPNPYHGPHQAHGFSFSVRRGVAVPPSLANMYKELEQDPDLAGTMKGGEGFKRPAHGCLEGWAGQGVLLLNTVLTVRQAQPNSHASLGWTQFTDAAIRAVNERCKAGVVFMLWGKGAEKVAGKVDKSRNLVLTSAHPSPLSAHRGFLGNGHFSKANKFLIERGRGAVEWGNLE